MNIEKAKFILSLIQDGDLPNQLENTDIVDFEINKKDEAIIIIRKDDKIENKKEYLKYIITKNNNKIGITKITEAGYNIFYVLVFASIAKVFLADLYNNYKKVMTYEFTNDVLNCDDVKDVKVIAKRDFINSTGRIRGVKK